MVRCYNPPIKPVFKPTDSREGKTIKDIEGNVAKKVRQNNKRPLPSRRQEIRPTQDCKGSLRGWKKQGKSKEFRSGARNPGGDWEREKGVKLRQ